MIKRIFMIMLWFFIVSSFEMAAANEFSGYIGVEGRLFFHSPASDDQKDYSASVAFQPEYYHKFESNQSIVFVPFARYDSADSERSHLDIREFNWLWATDSLELRVGVGKVFWGVTEFVHLVDIINQTDFIESVDLEEKLGQPMVQLSVPSDWGVFSLFVLPYFRERTFPDREGRLRFSIPIDTDDAIYESSAKKHHIDFAGRYSHFIGDWDIGLYYFRGTNREPWFLPQFNETGRLIHILPYYEQIDQAGLDAQLVFGQWLFKLETIYRWGQINRIYEENDFYASTGGFEYSFVRFAGTPMDLGIVAEWVFDERRENATTWYQNDLMAGFRLALNDAASTELLTWLMWDVDYSTRVFNVEASRRIGDSWKINLELKVFSDPSKDDLLYSIRDDDFVQIELDYYF